MKVPVRLVQVMPGGAAGVPVPSVLESFCIQEMPNWPAALELKMALFGDVAVMGGFAGGTLYRFFFKLAYAAARLIH